MKALHLSIDMQNYYGACWFSSRGWASLKANVVSLTNDLKKLDVPTVYVAFDKDFKPFKEGVGLYKSTPGETRKMLDKNSALDFGIPVLLSDLVAYKRDCSAYAELSISQYVRRNKYTDIILSGLFETGSKKEIEGCLSKTARDFRNAGYGVTIVAEATEQAIPRSAALSLNERKKNHEWFGVGVTPKKELLASLEAR